MSLWLIGLLAVAAYGQAVVTVKVQADAAGVKIPDDFCGVSFEMSNLLPDGQGKYLFTAKDKSLVALFKTLGIGNLRVGGNMADRAGVPIPGAADIDNLFAFAKAADVKVIYTLRLKQGDIAQDAKIAAYVEQHYGSELECLAIGNEPNFYLRKYPEYLKAWKRFAVAIQKAVPTAKFCGPSALYANSWPGNFARDLSHAGLLALVTEHDYPGGDAKGISAAAGRDRMLSPALDQRYQRFYDAVAAPVIAEGLPYRFEETSNFTGGVDGASNAFASSLWALDYLHWWAAHGADGINFHNRRWITNCVIAPERTPVGLVYRPRPIAYGLLAFSLSGHGLAEPLTISNPTGINLTAYAVRRGDQLFVTLINKEHGPTGREAEINISAPGMAKSGEVIFLNSPKGDVAAKAGITLGGSAIGEDEAWDGKWLAESMEKRREYSIHIHGASAAVVRIPLKD